MTLVYHQLTDLQQKINITCNRFNITKVDHWPPEWPAQATPVNKLWRQVHSSGVCVTMPSYESSGAATTHCCAPEF